MSLQSDPTSSSMPSKSDSPPPTLKNLLKVRDIWALGVGATITGEYMGWNLGMNGNSPIAMLIASLIACLLYLTWVLALSELSVAMPFAGGPLAYGRRAADPSLGFVMGWSMFLECLFATITIALATGGYVAFLVGTMYETEPSLTIQVSTALITVVIFFFMHAWGVKEQSVLMLVLTYGAIVGLLIFWGAAATSFSFSNVWTDPILPAAKGWKSVLDAVPYALWWLLIIETIALAAEEAHEPSRTIPRGLVWAQLTLIVLAGLTWLLACGAVSDPQALAKDVHGLDVSYPLAMIVRDSPAGKSNPIVVYGFGFIALFGLVSGYHGIMFGTSRQAFAMGRDGYLPSFLGKVHPKTRTPVNALAVSAVICAAFIILNIWFKDAIAVALLISTLTALVWYILAMGCLYVLRKKDPQLFQNFRAPLYRALPATVVILSIFAAYVYSGIDVKVVPMTAALYAIGLSYFWFFAHERVQRQETGGALGMIVSKAYSEAKMHTTPEAWYDPVLEKIAVGALGASVVSILWMILVAMYPNLLRLGSESLEAAIIIILMLVTLLLVSAVALRQTRK